MYIHIYIVKPEDGGPWGGEGVNSFLCCYRASSYLGIKLQDDGYLGNIIFFVHNSELSLVVLFSYYRLIIH